MSETLRNSDDNITVHIELTPKAIEKFNLAKDALEDKSKLALRISSCSRG